MNKNLRLLAFLAIIIGIFYINNKFNNKLLSIYYQAKKIPEIIAMSATVCVLLFPSLVDKELLMNIPILGNLLRSPIFRILFSGLNLGEMDNKDEIKKTDLIKRRCKSK
jgi:hypothetical protein